MKKAVVEKQENIRNKDRTTLPSSVPVLKIPPQKTHLRGKKKGENNPLGRSTFYANWFLKGSYSEQNF